MSTPRFDPGGFYEFNLAQGAVRTRDGERVVVVSEATLAALVGGNADAGSPLSALGSKLGGQAKASLGGDASGASPEVVMGHATSVLALFGLGRVSLERWGDAMVLSVSSAPEMGSERLADVLSGFFSELGGADVRCIPVAETQFLVADPEISDAVSGWAKQGTSVGEIVSRLGVENA